MFEMISDIRDMIAITDHAIIRMMQTVWGIDTNNFDNIKTNCGILVYHH